MTGTMVNLPRVIARSDDADFLRELIQDAAQRLMLEPVARWPLTVSMAVIVAVAVNTVRRREILGITVMPSEAETFRGDFLRSLTRRGLRAVQPVISDADEGLKAAACKVLRHRPAALPRAFSAQSAGALRARRPR